MAAITFSALNGGSGLREIVSSSATVTRWLQVPHWAKYAYIVLHPTTVGTSVTPSLLVADPISADDGNIMNLAEHAAFTAITGLVTYSFQIGPGITGIADDVTNAAAADSAVSINTVLPPVLGVRLVCSGACVVNLTVLFRP